MSKEIHKLEVIKESPKDNFKASKPVDLNDVEMIFGTPNSPKMNVQPDLHLIANEKRNGREPPTIHNKQNGDNEAETIPITQPLLEPDREKQKPPLAGPEIDDLDDASPTDHVAPFPGIDDGLLDPAEKKPDGHEGRDEDSNKGHDDSDEHHILGGNGTAETDDGKWWQSRGVDEADFPYDGPNGFGTRFGIDDRPGSPFPPGSIPDVNTYQQKKNLAQGMMDLALLSANANQLRYVVESSMSHPYYYPSLVFIGLSIILQIAVGVGLIMNSRYNVKDEKDICKADKINNMTVLGVFLITIVNVFITSFSVATPNVPGSAVSTAIQTTGNSG